MRSTSSTPAEVSLPKTPSPAQPARRSWQSPAVRWADRRCFWRCREAEAASQRLPPDRPHPAGPLRAGLQGLPHGEGPGGRSHLRREFAGAGCSALSDGLGMQLGLENRGDVSVQELLCFAPASSHENSPPHGENLGLCLKSSFKLQPRANAPPALFCHPGSERRRAIAARPLV